MTVRTVRVHTPVLGWAYGDIVTVDDTVPLYAALISTGRVAVYTAAVGQVVTASPNEVLRLGDVSDPASPTGAAVGVLTVAAIVAAPSVSPTGAWNFSQTPTVAGVPLGGGGGGTVVDATTTVKGIVELATTAEATTGTDTVRAVTPAGVKAVADTKAALAHAHAVADLTATGTRDATTFLRGDGTWSTTPAAQGAVDATTTVKGLVQLAGDLGGTAAAPTVPGLAAKAPLASPAFTGTPTGITKTHVGLGNVDNTADTAKPVSTAQQTALDAKVSRTGAKRTITGAYTLVAADASSDIVLHSTAATAVTITLPQDTAATIPLETPIPWRAYGAGQITFAAGTGATVLSRGSVFRSAGQNAEGVVTKTAANTWLVSGDLVA